MSDVNNGASADPADNGDSTTTTDGQSSAGSSGDTVSKADHARALADLKRVKAELKAKQDAEEKAKEAKLRESNQWKELYEEKERKAKEAEERAERIQKSYLNERRFSAVKEAAIKAGLRDEAYSDLDLLDLESEVEIESTSTGRINVLGADKFIERLKAKKPHWFGSKNPPAVDGTNPRVTTPKQVTVKQLLDAEKAAKKSGDSTEYHALLQQYRKQSR